MTDPSASMELNTPLNLTPEEKRAFGDLFRQADTEQMGVVTGEVAVKFFERTRLPPQVLGEIWQIADTENRGLLTQGGFCQVLRLIGHYQAGKAPTPELAFQPGPLPKFDGAPPGAPAPGPIQPQMSGPIRVPPLTPDRAAQYAALFEKSGANNGVLPGEMAKNIFEKARLPNETLGRIWALADTEQRGALGITEFIIAMHLIASLSSGAMKGLPSSLPAGLYEAASRRGSIRPPGAPQGPIQRQFSGQNTGRGQSPMGQGRPPFGTPPQTAQPTGNDWLISPQEKASYDNLFSKVDTQGRGFLTGEQAVVFFSDSGLPEDVLAAIWDLADINSEGQLNRDEFAVAMYLIRQQRPKPGVQHLPPSLPPNLVPPSMRNQARPGTQTQPQPASTFDSAAAFAAPAPAPPKSASEDLFGLDAFSSPPVQQQSTGGSAGNFGVNRDPFGSGAASPGSPSRVTFQPTPQNPSSIFKPFMPSSSFGQTLTAQGTGGSQGRSPAPPQPSAMDDLLGDNDQEQSKKLTDESAELGNMSNQINTLRTQMQETHNRKASTEADLNNTTAQKRDLEMRLSQFRSQYEAEVQIVKQLEERLNASRQETRKLQQELAMIEGTYQDLSGQHQQVAQALEADQRENANLKERIRQTNAEIAQMRPQLDKMRSDARQQKGMVAINKKQLATNEGERDKLKSEMNELTKAAQESYNRSPEATPGPSSNVGSPAVSTASHSTNPFFRRSPKPTENTMSPSGFSREASQANFDNFFGPSISSAQSGAPQTSFGGGSNVPAFSAPSGQSVQSSEPGVPTPSTSPPLSQHHESPRVGDPPAPPESRQFSSSILPIREGTGRQESFSSSVKASAPASRFGAGTGNETPTNAPGSPSASAAESAKETSAPDFGPSPFNRNLTSSPAASHASDAARSASGMERKDTFQSFGPPSAPVDMPGSFPEVSTPLQPEATGQSTMSDRSKGSVSFAGPRSDPFAAQQRAGSSAKADFDAAFAGFGSGKQFQERQNTGSSLNGSVGSASKFNQEFPPIENLGGDDDSDSNSEHGFDDNFAPASPQQTKREEPTPASATGGTEGTGDSVPSDAFHSAQSYPSTDKAASPSNQANSKQSFGDDFDSGFDDLAEAKDATNAHDDDDLFASSHRDGMDEFNPVFDSPTASKSNTMASQATPTNTASKSHAAEDSFSDFEHLTQSFASSKPTPSAAASSHDWDAIFSGLSDSQPAPSTTGNTAPQTAESSQMLGVSSVSERPATGDDAEKPHLARALSAGTEHDDPILKNLTSMGYPRDDALSALEQYDYDINKAVEYLSSKQ